MIIRKGIEETVRKGRKRGKYTLIKDLQVRGENKDERGGGEKEGKGQKKR